MLTSNIDNAEEKDKMALDCLLAALLHELDMPNQVPKIIIIINNNKNTLFSPIKWETFHTAYKI